MDGNRPDLFPADVELYKNGISAADPLLPVKIPVIFLGKTEGLRPDDRKTGEHRVSVQSLRFLRIRELDKFQPPGVVEAEGLRDLTGDAFIVRPQHAVVQFICENNVVGTDLLRIPQKIDGLLQIHAPLNIEDQGAEPSAALSGIRRKAPGLGLEKLGDHRHDLVLAHRLEQSSQPLSFFFLNSSHAALLSHGTAGQQVLRQPFLCPLQRMFFFSYVAAY